MSLTYDAAVKAITDIEEAMRNQRNNTSKKANGKSFLLLFTIVIALSAIALRASANTLDMAAKAYNKANYAEAIRIYKQLIKQKPSAILYYNLGKCLLSQQRSYPSYYCLRAFAEVSS